jgi:hypothetical protein
MLMRRFLITKLKHCSSKYWAQKFLHISEKKTFRQAGSGFLQILLRIQAKSSKIRTQAAVKSQNFQNSKIFSFTLHLGSKVIWIEIRYQFLSTYKEARYTVKKVIVFPVLSRDVTNHTFPGRE